MMFSSLEIWFYKIIHKKPHANMIVYHLADMKPKEILYHVPCPWRIKLLKQMWLMKEWKEKKEKNDGGNWIWNGMGIEFKRDQFGIDYLFYF